MAKKSNQSLAKLQYTPFCNFKGAKTKKFPREWKLMNGRVKLTLNRSCGIIDIDIKDVSPEFLFWMKNRFRGRDYRTADVVDWVNEYDLDLENK